jgi:hypothetical protein
MQESLSSVAEVSRGHALAGSPGKAQSTDNIVTSSGRDHCGRNQKGENLIGKAVHIQSAWATERLPRLPNRVSQTISLPASSTIIPLLKSRGSMETPALL